MVYNKYILAVASTIPIAGNCLEDFRLLNDDGITWSNSISMGPKVLKSTCVNKNLYKVLADDSCTYIVQVVGTEVSTYNEFYLAVSNTIPTLGKYLDSIHILHSETQSAQNINKDAVISQGSPLGRNLYKVIADNSMYLVQVPELEKNDRQRNITDDGR